MTDNGGRRNAGPQIRESHFWLGVLILFIVIFGGIWLAIPGAETRHRLTSPSGNVSLDVAERCSQSACVPVIVLDFLSPDGERYRNQCARQPESDGPVFVTVSADWDENENIVTLTHADAQANSETFTLNLAEDCAA